MSETDRDVLALLDRAAADTPPLHLDRDSVIGRGRQITRRRRAAGFGMAVGGLALAAALWLGPGLGGDLLGTQTVSPASVSWEVEEPTTLTVLDGVTRGGNVSPLTVTKAPHGSASATFTVEGVEETVGGTTMAGGADVFLGERATVVVWEEPAGAAFGADVLPVPDGWEIGASMGDDGIFYFATTDRGYLPEHLVLHDSALNVWTADGVVAQTAEVSDGRHTETVFALPELDVAGSVDESGIEPMRADWIFGSGGTEPWWRGGEDYEWFLVRGSDGARFLRMIWDDHDGNVVHHGEPVPATVVGGAAFGVFSFTPDEVPVDRYDYAYSYQWSADGQTWRGRDVEDTWVEDLPTSLDRIEFSLGPDGEPVATREGLALRPSAEQPRGEAWVWDDRDETVVLVPVGGQDVWAPVLRVDGRLGPPSPFWDTGRAVRVGEEEMWASRLPAGTAYLGAVEHVAGVEDQQWRILDGEPVPSHELGPEVVVAVDEAQGLWVAMRQGDGETPNLWDAMVGEVDGEGLVLDLDGTRHRVAVLSVTSGTAAGGTAGVGLPDVLPVLSEGSVGFRDTVQGTTGGVPAAGESGPGVVIRSTEIQCLKSAEACVEGLDTDGDGTADLAVHRDTVFAWALDEQPHTGTHVYGPGETVTIHGREFVVRDTASGWPALRQIGNGRSITTVDTDGLRTRVGAGLPHPSVRSLPGAWPWREDGVLVSVPGLVLADGLQAVVDVAGAWVEPAQVLVAQGRGGQVTLLVLEPGTTGATARVGIRGEDGTVVELPGEADGAVVPVRP